MKKSRAIALVLMIVLSLLCTTAVFASPTSGVSVSGPSVIRVEDTFTVEFKATCSEIYGMEAKFTESGPMTRQSITLNEDLTGWTYEYHNGVFMLYSNDLSTSFSGENTTLFTITYKLNRSALVGEEIAVEFNDVVLANHLTGEESDPFDVSYKKTVERKLSSNANLAALKINGEAPEGFDPEKTSYNFSVPYVTTTATIDTVCADQYANCTVTGAGDLKVGENIITVHVTAEDGTTKDYTVKVDRANPPDLARLNSLSAGSYTLSPAFEAEVFDYTVSVPYTKSSLSLTYTVDEGIRVTVEGGEKLEVGENIITVTVTDQYDNTSTYTVTVTRKKNNNTNLIKLSVDGQTLSPAFQYTTTEYTMVVNSSVSTLKVNATPAGDGATVLVTGEQLGADGGTVIITVTAMDGTTKNYVITVTREGSNPPVDPPIDPPDNPDDPVDPPATEVAKLNTLSIKDFAISPSFSATVYAYTLSVPNTTTSIKVLAYGANGCEIIITGADNLKVGENKVSVVVKENGKEDAEYVITVTRKEKPTVTDDAKLESITLSTGTLSPIFDPDVFSYIVYLPFETSRLTVSASAFNAENATITGMGDYTLLPGSNPIDIVVTPTSGSPATYKIIVYVMPAFSGTAPSIGSSSGNGSEMILTIVGTNQIGGKLTASFDGIDSYMVRWVRDGKPVGGKPDYIITTNDLGKTLTVEVCDKSGNVLATKTISIPKANTASLNQNKTSGFDAIGMIISLIAALATLVIGFILGKSFKKNQH